jgi:hypothetical protein
VSILGPTEFDQDTLGYSIRLAIQESHRYLCIYTFRSGVDIGHLDSLVCIELSVEHNYRNFNSSIIQLRILLLP